VHFDGGRKFREETISAEFKLECQLPALTIQPQVRLDVVAIVTDALRFNEFIMCRCRTLRYLSRVCTQLEARGGAAAAEVKTNDNGGQDTIQLLARIL